VVRLAARGHEIVLVATAPAAPEYTVTEDDFERLAGELGCPFTLGTDAGLLRDIDADVGVSVNWLSLLPQDMLDGFPHGILNGHPGDLPRYRGNAAPNWAILAGDDRIVATVHRMDSGLDEGPVLLQRPLLLNDRTYLADVYRFLDETFPALFEEALEGLEQGTLTPRPQPTDPELALRGYPRLPRDGELDWALPAEQLARIVRASSEPFAGAYSWLGERRTTIWRAHAEPHRTSALGTPGQVAERRPGEGEVAVLTGDGLLVLEEIELDGVRTLASKLLRSSRLRFGVDTAELFERLARLERLPEA
jgi:methionyl-tRNA formyltransferase